MSQELTSANAGFRGDLMRNIKSIRDSRQLFDDLSSDLRDWDVAMAIEAEERIPTSASVITRPFDYGSVISYVFDPAHWQATRFSDGRRYGVWYGSTEVETTVYETVFHWHRFLLDSYASEDRVIVGERRVFAVRCEALLIDLRGKEKAFPGLINRASYNFTQSLGAFLYNQGSNGALVRSARSEGINGAVLCPERLSNVRDKTMLTYRCNPVIDLCKVERSPGRTWMRVQPSLLY